jgi:hypothetical protein
MGKTVETVYHAHDIAVFRWTSLVICLGTRFRQSYDGHLMRYTAAKLRLERAPVGVLSIRTTVLQVAGAFCLSMLIWGFPVSVHELYRKQG